MASVNRNGDRWTVRYREPGGRAASQRERTFSRKADAQAFATKMEHEKLSGTYADPSRARLTFGELWEAWMAAQPHKPATADTYQRHYRNHIQPTFARRPLAAIRKTEVQGWVKGLSAKLAPATVKVVYGIFASALRAAVQDDRLGKSPCVGITLPDVPKTTVRVLDPAQVQSLADEMPSRLRALIWLGVGSGLRQGEAFGVCRSRVLWLERTLRVDQQVSLVTGTGNGPVLASPKTRASIRDVPLADVVTEALSRHVADHQPEEVLFTSRTGGLLRRSSFNSKVWRPAAKRAGLPGDVTFHDLRHTFASAALSQGVPILDVSRWLGHASITETADTYGHLLPESHDRLRDAVDVAFGSSEVRPLPKPANG
jgi:integrase